MHPDFRGRGIATDLICAMVAVVSKGQDICVTTYRESDNKGKAARALYAKMGFIAGELVEEFGYPCQKFIYHKS